MKQLQLIAGLTLALASTLVQANSEQCNYSVDYDIKIAKQQITFTKLNSKNIVFEGERLLIDGQQVELSAEQRRTSLAFQVNTRKIVPKIADIAIEGAELGVKAATIAITSLLGDGAEVDKDLIQPIEAISAKIKANVDKNTLNTAQLEKSFEQDLDHELENLISKAISKYSVKMLSQILSAIFSDDEEMKDFEFRMDKLDHDMQVYVEANAKKLELKAGNLCKDLKTIAILDKQLESVDGYPKNGLIEEDGKNGFKVSKFNLSFD